MTNDSLGDRMKAYEGAYKYTLPPRQPTVIRVDGKSFHTYTKGIQRPWCAKLSSAMDEVALQLCKNIQTVQMAYVQSDEISLLLHPYIRYQTQPWFAGEVQKMVSVSASIAATTMTVESEKVFGKIKPAYFDSRVFVLPTVSEVLNYFLWRQQDATRNSVQMLARSMFSHKECDRKSCEQLKVMCADKGQPWEEVPAYYRHGRGIMRDDSGKWSVFKDIDSFSVGAEMFSSLLSEDNE